MQSVECDVGFRASDPLLRCVFAQLLQALRLLHLLSEREELQAEHGWHLVLREPPGQHHPARVRLGRGLRDLLRERFRDLPAILRGLGERAPHHGHQISLL